MSVSIGRQPLRLPELDDASLLYAFEHFTYQGHRAVEDLIAFALDIDRATGFRLLVAKPHLTIDPLYNLDVM